MKSVVATVLFLAACTKEPPVSREADSATTAPAAPAKKCAADTDCKAQSLFCGDAACSCVPALASEPAEVCKGPVSKCYVEPCTGKKATCKEGACVLGKAM